jgi:hypothetical protein
MIIGGPLLGDMAAGGKSCSLSSISLFICALIYEASSIAGQSYRFEVKRDYGT